MTTQAKGEVRYAAERMLWRVVFVGAALIFLCVLMPILWHLFSPFVIGLAVAALLHPLIRWMQQKMHMRRGLAVGVCTLAVVAVAALLLYWFSSFVVVQAAEAGPGVVNSVVEMLRTATNKLLDMAKTLPEFLGETIRGSLNTAYKTLTDTGMVFAGNLVNGAVSFAAKLPYAFIYANFLILAIIFITNRYEAWHKKLADSSIGGKQTAGIGLLRQSAGRGMAGYIRVQLLFALLTCLISWVFFQTVGFRYAFVIGFTAALLELIPQFGCGVLYIPWSLICFLVGQTRNGWLVLGLYLGYSLLRRVTEPALLGTNLGVSPLASLVGMFVGMRVGGIFGLILGPIVMVVLVSAVHSHLFDGVITDIKTIARCLRARWQRGLEKMHGTD